MQEFIMNLSELVIPEGLDSISGRRLGEGYAEKNQFLAKIKSNTHVTIVIDDESVRSINDSFIKGLFSDVFKFLKTKNAVETQVTLNASEDFKDLFSKNFTILEAIYNKA